MNWSVNGMPNSRVADNNGNYTIGVPSGWTGTVTPSKSCYTFSPSYIPYSNVVTDYISQDYIATFQPTSILSGNAGMPGATLWYMDNGPKTAWADGSGNYTITVPCGWSGTVTSYMTGYTFTPLNRSYANLASNQTAQDYTAQACGGCADIHVLLGGNTAGKYTLSNGQEQRINYPLSGGPVVVHSANAIPVVAATRLQSMANNTLYSFVETMGVPAGLLSSKYYFPTYNNTWAPLNSQLRFANLDPNPTTIRVTIGSNVVWEQSVAGETEQRLTFPVSGGPVIVESTDTTKKIVAAIRLQSMVGTTLYSFAETLGIPFEQLSYKYYFATYNNTWAPLNSQLRFANLNDTDITVKVTIGSDSWTYPVLAHSERREYLAVSGGPVIVESTDPTKPIIAAIRLQSMANTTLYSFVETMGVPDGLLSYKYYFPTYNNTWAPLNSQLRFANLNDTDITVKVTIGSSSWTYPVPAHSERREYLAVSGGPVTIESTDPTKPIIAAIRLQSLANNTLYSFAETLGIPVEKLADTYYFATYNNTWAPLNSQLRFSVP